MAVVVIDTIKPKNQGTFPIVEAADVKVTNSKRLDAALNDKANQSDLTALQTTVSGKASQADLTALSEAVSGKASQADLTALSNTVAGKQNTLSSAQLAAANSGITSELVTQIGTNTTAIAGKASATDLATTNAAVATKAEASDLTTATNNLQSQIDNIVGGSTEDSEVINARVGEDGTSYNTLKARLDAEATNTNNQIDNTNQNVDEISNKLGWFPVKLTNGYMLQDGTFAGGDSYRSRYCDVAIDPDKTYQYKGVGRNLAYSCIYYDNSGSIIGRQQIESNTYVDVTIPAGTVKARFSSYAAYSAVGDEDNIVFGVKFSGVASDLTDLSDNVNNYLSAINDNLEETSALLKCNNKNIFNIDYIAKGQLLNSNGKTSAAAGFNTTHFISLAKFSVGVAISGKIRIVCYYDEFKNLISYLAIDAAQQASYTETLANIAAMGAKYIRFTYYANVNPQVEDNTVTTAYLKPVYGSEATESIANRVDVDSLKNFFDPSDSSYLVATLTDTYGFVDYNGNVQSVGNTNYNYAPVAVEAGKTYLIHSALYKAVTPFVFVGTDGTVIKSTNPNAGDDPSITEMTLEFIPPMNGTCYINYYQIPIWIANVETAADFGNLKASKLPAEIAQGWNTLYGKKWAVCGDSFTYGDFSGSSDSHVIPDGRYQGYNAVYGYLIGSRNNMDIQQLASGGKTLALPADGSFTNSFTYTAGSSSYQNIAADVDYITIYFGINDSHHRPNSSGSDGEDQTGVIELGTITDNTTATFYGAWNVVLSWLVANRPFAHIGIIVSNGCETDEYRQATIAIANKYGIPYIDLNGDSRTPCMLRSTNANIASSVRDARTAAQRVSQSNGHPSVAAHEYESWFIEDFLRSI